MAISFAGKNEKKQIFFCTYVYFLLSEDKKQNIDIILTILFDGLRTDAQARKREREKG
jgi:hypothetical protein